MTKRCQNKLKLYDTPYFTSEIATDCFPIIKPRQLDVA